MLWLKKWIDNLKEIKKNYNKKMFNKKIEKKYENLKPKKDLKIASIEALHYAFKDKNVKNIAITGNYSSGKSSIIESYINKNLGRFKKKKVNTISLATFSKENEDTTVEDLEKYIIEQLYYSTYNKILDNNKLKSWLLAIFIYLMIIVIMLIARWDILYFYFFNRYYIKVTIAAIFFIISFFIIWILKNILKYIYKIDKFALQIMDLNIEIGNNGSDNNIINKNIELIIKIFREFRYKYIIFEDLDRFDKPIIFEHLRELNNILNKNFNVKFFYLIKDDIFKGENRTKFFDYIYPIVPYVSYATSGEEMNKLVKEYSLSGDLTENFILNITAFVQDMRILKNTLNEYRVYKADLNKDGIEPQKLFSIILYKNVFSEDFSKLQKNEGVLVKFLNKKIEKVNEIKELINIDTEILESDLVIKDIKELFCRAAEKIIMQRNIGSSITLTNAEKGNRGLDAGKKIDFEYLTDVNTRIPSNYIERNSEQFWREFSPTLYNLIPKIKREENIKKEELEEELEVKKQELVILEAANIKTLIQMEVIKSEEFEVFNSSLNKVENTQKAKLVKYLLQEGYIDEEYREYIEKFHEGSISKRDNDFLGNCLIKNDNDFLEILDNPDKVIDRTELEHFNTNSILNIYILKELLNKVSTRILELLYLQHIEQDNYVVESFLQEDEKIYLTKLNNFIKTLVNNVEFSEKMIHVKNEIKEKYPIFCKLVASNEVSLIKIIEKFSNNERKEEFLKDVLFNANIQDIQRCYAKNEVKQYIEKNNILLQESNCEAAIRIIRELDIKYTDLNSAFNDGNKIFEYCINNENFEINKTNIEIIVRMKTNIREASIKDYMKKNFNIIRKDSNLYNYIKENINLYLENVYFKYKNAADDSTDIIELLNNDNLTFEYKEKIVEYESKVLDENDKSRIGIIEKLEAIIDSNVYPKLLERQLIKMSYTNVNTFFEKNINIKIPNDITEEEKQKIEENIANSKKVLVNFLNERGKILKNEANEHNNAALFRFIFFENELNDEIYKILIKAFKRWYVSLENVPFVELDESKKKIAIQLDSIQFNENTYKSIRNIGGNVFVFFVYKHRTKIKNDISNYIFNANEIKEILMYNKFSNEFKEIVLKNLKNYNEYDFDKLNANIIANYIIDNNIKIDFSIEQLKKFVECCGDDNVKLKVLNEYFDLLNKNDIEELLNSSLVKYRKLIINRTRPIYDYSIELKNFIDNLKRMGYYILYLTHNNIIQISPTNR